MNDGSNNSFQRSLPARISRSGAPPHSSIFTNFLSNNLQVCGLHQSAPLASCSFSQHRLFYTAWTGLFRSRCCLGSFSSAGSFFSLQIGALLSSHRSSVLLQFQNRIRLHLLSGCNLSFHSMIEFRSMDCGRGGKIAVSLLLCAHQTAHGVTASMVSLRVVSFTGCAKD